MDPARLPNSSAATTAVNLNSTAASTLCLNFGKPENFPRPCEDLPQFPIRQWGPLVFIGLEPAYNLEEILNKMDEYVGFLPLEAFSPQPYLNKDYLVNCHWALYCDNYLEGFHIPFVHADLNAVLDYGSYQTEIHGHMNVQIGYAEGGEEVFDLPKGHRRLRKTCSSLLFLGISQYDVQFLSLGTFCQPGSAH